MNSTVRNPIVLVHGLFDTSRKMRHFEKYLRNAGWMTYSINLLPNSGKLGIDELAQQLDIFIKEKIQPNQKFDLIGFSMGGLVSRYYIQQLGGISRIEHYITISTPHHGTGTAYFLNNSAGKQMRMNSEFMDCLNKEIEQLKLLKFTSIWTPFDLMIIPASSSHVSIGNEYKIKCFTHWLMLNNHTCMQILKEELLKI